VPASAAAEKPKVVPAVTTVSKEAINNRFIIIKTPECFLVKYME
jgi:hypothetical protein